MHGRRDGQCRWSGVTGEAASLAAVPERVRDYTGQFTFCRVARSSLFATCAATTKDAQPPMAGSRRSPTLRSPARHGDAHARRSDSGVRAASAVIARWTRSRHQPERDLRKAPLRGGPNRPRRWIHPTARRILFGLCDPILSPLPVDAMNAIRATSDHPISSVVFEALRQSEALKGSSLRPGKRCSCLSRRSSRGWRARMSSCTRRPNGPA